MPSSAFMKPLQKYRVVHFILRKVLTNAQVGSILLSRKGHPILFVKSNAVFAYNLNSYTIADYFKYSVAKVSQILERCLFLTYKRRRCFFYGKEGSRREKQEAEQDREREYPRHHVRVRRDRQRLLQSIRDDAAVLLFEDGGKSFVEYERVAVCVREI